MKAPAGVFINTFRIVGIVLFLTKGKIIPSDFLHKEQECVRNKHIWQLWLKFTSLVLISFLQVRFLLTFSEKVMANNFTPEINHKVWVVRLLILLTVLFARWSVHCLLYTGYAWDTLLENKFWCSWSYEVHGLCFVNQWNTTILSQLRFVNYKRHKKQ